MQLGFLRRQVMVDRAHEFARIGTEDVELVYRVIAGDVGMVDEADLVSQLHHTAGLAQGQEHGPGGDVPAIILDEQLECGVPLVHGQHQRVAAGIAETGVLQPATDDPDGAVITFIGALISRVGLFQQAFGFLARQAGQGRDPGNGLFFSGEGVILEGDIHIDLFRQFGESTISDAIAQQNTDQGSQQGQDGSREGLANRVLHVWEYNPKYDSSQVKSLFSPLF